MTMILLTALAVGAITICAGHLYYCTRPTDSREDDETETSKAETQSVRINILYPYPDASSDDSSTVCGSKENSDESNDEKETAQIANEDAAVPPEESQIVPVEAPCNPRRSSATIWSPSMRAQLGSITNSSSEACVTTKTVRAQVEVHPEMSLLTNKETSELLRSVPQRRDVNSDRLLSNDAKARKLSARIVAKWRNIRKTLLPSRPKKLIQLQNLEYEETERLNIPVPVPGQRSSVGYSTILQKNRLVDASTSTRISSNILTSKERTNEIVKNHESTDNESKVSCAESFESSNARHPNTEALRDVVSLINQRSVNGKSICDVRITGLSMNQSEFLDLFEASGGKSQSASIITTEEASIICIKFHRDRRSSSNLGIRMRDNIPGCPLRRFYKNLPEKFEDNISKLFRSQEQSEKPDRSLRSVQHSDHSKIVNAATNETSYMTFPKNR